MCVVEAQSNNRESGESPEQSCCRIVGKPANILEHQMLQAAASQAMGYAVN